MIIDNHVHIGKSEKFLERTHTFNDYYMMMQEVGIEYSGVIPNLSSIVPSSELNIEMMKQYSVSKFKQYFFPIIVIDPKDMRTLKQIDIYSKDIIGVKYHPSISECPLVDKTMEIFLMEIYKRHNSLPILVHCGRHWRSSITYIIELAQKYKFLTFIAAHMGGNVTDLVIKAIGLLKKVNLDNIYLDTSAAKLPWLIEEAVRSLGPERILFGSDEPYADVRISKYCLDLCNISDTDKELIFHKNFEKVYFND